MNTEERAHYNQLKADINTIIGQTNAGVGLKNWAKNRLTRSWTLKEMEWLKEQISNVAQCNIEKAEKEKTAKKSLGI
jgi:hypothetical protein